VNNTSIFCPYPFSYVSVQTDGGLEVCCEHQSTSDNKFNINSHSIDEWFNSDYRKELQDYFRRGERHPGCDRCWRRESMNTGSLRTTVQKEYQILGVTDSNFNELIAMEAQVGNLCNLKCLMCNETQSSVVLQENTQLGINQYTQKDFTWTETGMMHLDELVSRKLKAMNFRGGEPLYNKKIKSLLSNFPQEKANSMMLHLTTNATVWDQSWADILSKFKLVRMMLSVDAVAVCYEYIRFPASCKTVESNIQTIIKMPNVKPVVHCTVQNLNILHLDKLIKWCVDHQVYIEFNVLVWPQYLRPVNLPKPLIKQALLRLRDIEDICTPKLVDSNLKSIIDILTKSLNQDSDTKLWEEFVDNIQLKDQFRNNSYKNILTDN
jgi:MoaA/NifB/PqqE/SkfB family radical SAM enzyme